MSDELEQLMQEENILSDDWNERLTLSVRRLEKFESEKAKDFSDSIELENIVKFIGDTPPIKLIEDVLSYYKQKKQKLKVDTIPTLLNQAGLSKATTIDGIDISIRPEVSVTINNKEMLNRYIEEKGFGYELKEKLSFPKGEVDGKLNSFLEKEGYNFARDKGIHYKTLQKVLKDLNEGGVEMPNESIATVNFFDIAKIK